jgi:hypothetical protein
MLLVLVYLIRVFFSNLTFYDLGGSSKRVSNQVEQCELGSMFEYGGDARKCLLILISVIVLAVEVLLDVLLMVLRQVSGKPGLLGNCTKGISLFIHFQALGLVRQVCSCFTDWFNLNDKFRQVKLRIFCVGQGYCGGLY